MSGDIVSRTETEREIDWCDSRLLDYRWVMIRSLGARSHRTEFADLPADTSIDDSGLSPTIVPSSCLAIQS